MARNKRTSKAGTVLLLSFFAVAFSATLVEASDQRLNVVFILADDLGWVNWDASVKRRFQRRIWTDLLHKASALHSIIRVHPFVRLTMRPDDGQALGACGSSREHAG